MPQFNQSQPSRLQAILDAYVQRENQNKLNLLEFRKKKHDNDVIGAIAQAYQGKVNTASEKELPQVSAELQEQLYPYIERNPNTVNFALRNFGTSLQGRENELNNEKINIIARSLGKDVNPIWKSVFEQGHGYGIPLTTAIQLLTPNKQSQKYIDIKKQVNGREIVERQFFNENEYGKPGAVPTNTQIISDTEIKNTGSKTQTFYVNGRYYTKDQLF